MKITFRTRKLQKLANSQVEAQKALGSRMALLLLQRLMELQAAVALSDISRLKPARCHELTGDLAGHLSVDLKHPYRLIFVPANEPVPRKRDGGLDWSKVTGIEIVDILDTH